MTRRWLILLSTSLAMSCANAVDIPMKRSLATNALDSKTCYGTILSEGQLVGYEIASGLLVSSKGKLVEIPALGAFIIGKLEPRHYAGKGIEITIVPQTTAKHEDKEEPISIVLEEGVATISDNGVRQRIPVLVRELCTS